MLKATDKRRLFSSPRRETRAVAVKVISRWIPSTPGLQDMLMEQMYLMRERWVEGDIAKVSALRKWKAKVATNRNGCGAEAWNSLFNRFSWKFLSDIQGRGWNVGYWAGRWIYKIILEAGLAWIHCFTDSRLPSIVTHTHHYFMCQKFC